MENHRLAREESLHMDCPCLAARSFYAKDHEHISLGRSPGFWLQTLLVSPSHSILNSGLLCC